LIPFQKAALNRIINSTTATAAEKKNAQTELNEILKEEKAAAKIKSDAIAAEKV
jgi:hypothetical protein